MLLGAVLTAQASLESPVHHVMDERGFPGAGHSGDRRQGPQRDPDIDALEVVEPRAFDVEPANRRPACRRHPDALFAGQILAGEGAGLAYRCRWSLIDDLTARCA